MAPAAKSKSFQETIRELWQLVKDYGRQETVDPLKHLVRRVGFGVVGSMLFAFGWFLLAMGLMRYLQTHVEFFHTRDWLVYFLAVIFLAVGMAGAVRKITHPDPDLTTPGRRDDRAERT